MPRNLLLAPPPVKKEEDREALQVPVDGVGGVDGLLAGDNERDTIAYPEGSNQYYRSRRTTTTAWPGFDLSESLPRTRLHRAPNIRQHARFHCGLRTPDTEARAPSINHELPNRRRATSVRPPLPVSSRSATTGSVRISGGPLPNRFVTLTGDLSEDIYGSPEVENPNLFDAFAPSEAETFFDALTARGVTWKVFEHGYGFTRMMRKYTFDETNIVGFKNRDHGFVETAMNGTLPQV